MRSTGRQLSVDIHKANPDLVFVPGDWSRGYRFPLRLGIPYVLIEQDVASMRRSLNPLERAREREMIECAAAIVFTSEEHQDYVRNNFACPPSIVIHLKPLAKHLCFVPQMKTRHKTLVYAGGLTGPRYRGPFAYKNLLAVFQAFMRSGWEVHVYPDKGCERPAYDLQQYGIKVHRFYHYQALLPELSQYTAGIVGFNTRNVPEQPLRYAQTCRPNKLWDYLAAGIPTIGVNLGGASRVLADGGWGVTVDLDNDDLSRIDLPEVHHASRFANVLEVKEFSAIIKAALGCEVDNQSVLQNSSMERSTRGCACQR